MLRAQDHVGGLHRDAGQEQPPRAGAQHALHHLNAARRRTNTIYYHRSHVYSLYFYIYLLLFLQA